MLQMTTIRESYCQIWSKIRIKTDNNLDYLDMYTTKPSQNYGKTKQYTFLDSEACKYNNKHRKLVVKIKHKHSY